jgi:hypothetical protein
MGLSRKLRYDYLSRKNFALHHSCPLFLGQVISLVFWKSIMAGSILSVIVDFQCSIRLRNLILNDLIGVMQSITARLNSFLHQTNNNLHVIIAVEKATGPPVWGSRTKLVRYSVVCGLYISCLKFNIIFTTYNFTIIIICYKHLYKTQNIRIKYTQYYSVTSCIT